MLPEPSNERCLRRKMNPVVSVTIVLYNSDDHLEECLNSIRAPIQSGFAELLVVDNASPDHSIEILERGQLHASCISAGSNRGFAAGVNLAWPAVQGTYWLLLNPDVRVPENGLETLIDWMEQNPKIGAASPEIEDDRGARRSPGHRFPSAALTLLEMSRLHLLLSSTLRGRLLRGSYWTGGDQLDVEWVPGTCLVVRREAVEKAGLLSEDFFMYGEDIEWCERIRAAGWKIGVCSKVAVVHREGSSSVRSLGREETRRRMVRGIYEACRQIRGPLAARGFAVSQAVALSIESAISSRSFEHRSRSRAFARDFWTVARDV